MGQTEGNWPNYKTVALNNDNDKDKEEDYKEEDNENGNGNNKEEDDNDKDLAQELWIVRIIIYNA